MVKQLSKQDWVMIGEWSTPFLMDSLTVEAASEKWMVEDAGLPLGYSKQLLLNHNNYLYKESYDAIERFLLEKLEQGTGFFDWLKNISAEYEKELLDFSKKVRLSDVGGSGDDELRQMFTEFARLCKKSMSVSYLMQPLDNAFEAVMRKKLQLYLEKNPGLVFESVLARLTPPKRLASMSEERTELLKIALKSKQGDVKEDLAKHAVEYGWMENFLWTTAPSGAEYYAGKIKDVLESAEAELERIDSERAALEKEYERIVSAIEEEGIEIKALAETVREFVNINMESWESVARSGNDCMNLFTELGKRQGLSYIETLYLSHHEMLSGGKKEKARARMKMKGLFVDGAKIVEMPAAETEELLAEFNKIDDVSEVKGSVAFPGKAQGKAAVVMSSAEIGKVNDGDVLVCPMTNPDFMTGAEKACAIVTDHGGVLCHAAIISREFQIPCVIGTGHATKVFKDGDVVEVDAEKGVVRKK
jgi:phosphohistidine swiveling domain-containing protein